MFLWANAYEKSNKTPSDEMAEGDVFCVGMASCFLTPSFQQSEQLILFHERCNVHMEYTAAVLNKIVPCNQIFRIIIVDAFKGTIFPVFCLDAVHDCHSNLNVGIGYVTPSENEITFQLSDSANTDIIAFGSRIDIYSIFQRRTVMNPFVCVQGKIETEVGQIVFLFAGD